MKAGTKVRLKLISSKTPKSQRGKGIDDVTGELLMDLKADSSLIIATSNIGFFRTSPIKGWSFSSEGYEIRTLNSVYRLVAL